MEQRASVASLGQPRPSSGFGLEDGPSFLEILAAQREARRAAGETTGARPVLRRDDARIPVAPAVFTDIDDVVTDADLADSDGERAPRRRRVFGQGMVEYALVLVLIALVVIVLLGMVGHQVQDVFSNLSRGLAS